MNEELSTVITPITENQISAIDEEKLPQVFVEQVKFLEKANQEYSKAEEKEKQAREKVETALEEADALIEAAKNVGGHTARKRKFLWKEYTTQSDEIDALKQNLKELVDHSEDGAEAQKKLAEVQSSLMESQTAILQVQKAHMEYQRQIANATKFVFGLSAYNMAASQSVLIKLKAILSEASEEQLGELAQQQLFLALDQIRNQESIITRINENDNLIENLNLEIEKKQKEIDEIGELDQEQNRRISANAIILEEHEKALTEQQQKDEEHDKRIFESEQDIDNLEKQDEEQDKLIAVGIEKDKEHDERISENAQDIDELERQDEEQDKKIADIAKKIDEHGKTLEKHSKRDAELEQKIQDVSQNTAEIIADINVRISENADATNKNIALIESDFEKQIGDINETFRKSNANFDNKLANLSVEFKNTIDELKGDLENQTKDINAKIEDLENRINSLDRTVSKKVWKIAVSVVAGASLLLNILQLLGIL